MEISGPGAPAGVECARPARAARAAHAVHAVHKPVPCRHAGSV